MDHRNLRSKITRHFFPTPLHLHDVSRPLLRRPQGGFLRIMFSLSMSVWWKCNCESRPPVGVSPLPVRFLESLQAGRNTDPTPLSPPLSPLSPPLSCRTARPSPSVHVCSAEAPDPATIPPTDLVGVTVTLITCCYKQREFIRVGYYVNNEHNDPAVNAEIQVRFFRLLSFRRGLCDFCFLHSREFLASVPIAFACLPCCLLVPCLKSPFRFLER